MLFIAAPCFFVSGLGLLLLPEESRLASSRIDSAAGVEGGFRGPVAGELASNPGPKNDPGSPPWSISPPSPRASRWPVRSSAFTYRPFEWSISLTFGSFGVREIAGAADLNDGFEFASKT